MILLLMTPTGTASKTAPAIETLDRIQCLELLSGERVGRFGTTLDAMPAVLPVNFVLLEGDVLVRTIPGSRLAAAVTNSVVAFEADGFSSDGLQGWSVQIRGVAREITDPDEFAAAEAAGLVNMALPGVPQRYLRISTIDMTGRRFDHRK
jgi:nitroimidazol reductase NimA-like FMN-containing flavoprotein (pyridoxamine 5'-phosphate oxidase superfamily)